MRAELRWPPRARGLLSTREGGWRGTGGVYGESGEPDGTSSYYTEVTSTYASHCREGASIVERRLPPPRRRGIPTVTAPADQSGRPARRPLRADAQRNYDALLDEAREALTAQGDSSLEAIAKPRGRRDRHAVQALPEPARRCSRRSTATTSTTWRGSAADAVALPRRPGPEVETWFRAFSAYAATKRILFQEIMDMAGREAEVFSHPGP